MNPITGPAAGDGGTRGCGCHEGVAALVETAHVQMLRLCTLLEEVADSLPAGVDRDKCLRLACELEPLVRGIHRMEEEALFPAYGRVLDRQGRGRASLERLMAEHVEDEGFAGELTDALLQLARTGEAGNPEALGFMLRGFFEAKRRHVAFEREHVLPGICGQDR